MENNQPYWKKIKEIVEEDYIIKMEINKRYKEGQEVLEAFEDGVRRTRLRKLIGEMATEDLRMLYNRLMKDKFAPTAEELVDALSN